VRGGRGVSGNYGGFTFRAYEAKFRPIQNSQRQQQNFVTVTDNGFAYPYKAKYFKPEKWPVRPKNKEILIAHPHKYIVLMKKLLRFRGIYRPPPLPPSF